MRKNVYKGRYITVSEELIGDHVYERMELLPGVHILPIRDDKILLMNEYRSHEKGSRWKLVTGWCDKSEKTPLDHAKEELAEELGMQAETWVEFFDGSVPNATVNGNTKYFLCKDISELDEKIENPDLGCVVNGYKWFDYHQVFELINQGKMYPGASSMIALWCLYNESKQS